MVTAFQIKLRMRVCVISEASRVEPLLVAPILAIFIFILLLLVIAVYRKLRYQGVSYPIVGLEIGWLLDFFV